MRSNRISKGTKKFKIVILLFLLGFVGCTRHLDEYEKSPLTSTPAATEGKRIAKEIAWGKAIRDLRIGLAFMEQKCTYHRGKEVGFEVYAQNVSKKPIKFSFLHANELAWHPIVDSDLNIELPGIMTVNGDLSVMTLSLDPSETSLVVSVRLVICLTDESERAGQPALGVGPGRYKVSFVPHVYSPNREDPSYWLGKVGELTSGSLELKVLPTKVN